ncbi:MAG: hypothetical protein KKE20_05630, partial [Nanoarchaeota archaeon]|nr:hypothetical protein [Nanoarchaeota archaeon]
MANEGEVKTDVDRLIDLVKESKEISVEEVAKKLGIPAYTVEALSDLLEEEGMLHIKYKFTTPYLTSEMPSGPKSKAVKKREQELVIEKEQEKIKLKKAAESVKVEVKDLGKRVIKTGKEEGSDKKTLQAKEIKPETEMEEPKAEDVSWPTAGEGEDEEAKEDEAPPLRVIVQNQGSISGQNPSLKQPKSSQSVTEAPKLKMPKENKPVPKAEEKKPEDAPKISPEPLKKKEELGIPETDDLDELIKRANDFISKGDFEGARQVYLRIKKIKKDLPKKFV